MLVEGTGAIQLGKSSVWKKELSEMTSLNNLQMLLVSSHLILLSSLHESLKQVLKTSAAALCNTTALCIGIGFCHCWIL